VAENILGSSGVIGRRDIRGMIPAIIVVQIRQEQWWQESHPFSVIVSEISGSQDDAETDPPIHCPCRNR
jgi:hypothetical protein